MHAGSPARMRRACSLIAIPKDWKHRPRSRSRIRSSKASPAAIWAGSAIEVGAPCRVCEIRKSPAKWRGLHKSEDRKSGPLASRFAAVVFDALAVFPFVLVVTLAAFTAHTFAAFVIAFIDLCDIARRF